MNLKSSFKKIETNKLACITLQGDEEFFKRKLLKYIVAKSKFPLTRIDAADCSVKDILLEINDVGFLNDGKTIVVMNFNKLKKAEISELLNWVKENKKSKDKNLVLVSSDGALGMTVEVSKGFRENSLRLDCLKLKSYGVGLPNYIKEICSFKNTQIDSGAVNLLVQFVGNDLDKIESEICKYLVYLKGTEFHDYITKDVVAKLMSDDLVVTPFDLMNALGHKNFKKSIYLLNKLHDEDTWGFAPSVVVNLFRQFEKLLVTKTLLENGSSEAVIAAKLKIHPFLVQKEVIPQTNNFTSKELLKLFHKIGYIDRTIKIGKENKLVLLETFIGEICYGK